MSDQGYGGPPRWDEPYGDPQYPAEQYGPPAYDEPHYGEPHYGQPNFGPPQYRQPSDPNADPSPPSGGGKTLLLVVLAIAVVAALGIGGFVLLSNDDTNSASSSTSLPSGGYTDPSLPVNPVPLPSISLPTLSLPSIPSLPVAPPSGASLTDPCSFASTMSQAATIYVGLAEIGQSTTAQGCVYRNTVPRSVTASISVAGSGEAKLYIPPLSTTGPLFVFRTVDGAGRLEVTVTKESDGKLYVTKVGKS